MHDNGRLCDGSVFGESEGHGRSLKVMEDKKLAVSSMSYFVQMAPRITVTVIRKLLVLGLDWPGLAWIWTWELDLGLTINTSKRVHLSGFCVEE